MALSLALLTTIMVIITLMLVAMLVITHKDSLTPDSWMGGIIQKVKRMLSSLSSRIPTLPQLLAIAQRLAERCSKLLALLRKPRS